LRCCLYGGDLPDVSMVLFRADRAYRWASAVETTATYSAKRPIGRLVGTFSTGGTDRNGMLDRVCIGHRPLVHLGED